MHAIEYSLTMGTIVEKFLPLFKTVLNNSSLFYDVGVSVGPSVGEGVSVGVRDGVSVGDGVDVGVNVGVIVGVLLGVAVGVNVTSGSCMGLGPSRSERIQPPSYCRRVGSV